MKSKSEQYQKAVELRRNGWSYKEIQKNVKVAKSTLSYWLKDIPLSDDHRKRLYTKKISILTYGSQSQRERRKREIDGIKKAARKDVTLPLSKQTYRLLGAALYWAEGSKGRGFEITNSDPQLILFMVKWLENIFGIQPSTLKASLNMYDQQKESDIKKFWSELTNIPLDNFGKSYIKPPNKGYKKNTLYYGTIKIRVPKSVDLTYCVLGWIEKSMKDINSDVTKTQKKWNHLKNKKRPVNL